MADASGQIAKQNTHASPSGRGAPDRWPEYGRFRLGAAVVAGGGVFVAARSLSAWEPIGIFVGVAAVGVAIGATSLFRILVDQLNVARSSRRALWRGQVSAAALEVLLKRIERLEQPQDGGNPASTPSAASGPSAVSTAMVNLAEVGEGNMDLLTAATLDGSVFPRLATAMPDEGHGVDGDRALPPTGDRLSSQCESRDVPDRGGQDSDGRARDGVVLSGGVETRNIFRQWQQAVKHHDLRACRGIHATLAATLAPRTLVPLTRQLAAVAGEVERGLRMQFAEALHRRDYHAALETGVAICELLPDRPIAAEFRRIHDHLARRAV